MGVYLWLGLLKSPCVNGNLTQFLTQASKIKPQPESKSAEDLKPGSGRWRCWSGHDGGDLVVAMLMGDLAGGGFDGRDLVVLMMMVI